SRSNSPRTGRYVNQDSRDPRARSIARLSRIARFDPTLAARAARRGDGGSPMRRWLLLSCLGSLATGSLPSAQVTRLNPRFEFDQTVGAVRDFRVHPSGAEVLFRVDARHAGAFELYRAPLDGSRRPLPVVPMSPGRSVEHYEFSADGQWVVFTGDKESE